MSYSMKLETALTCKPTNKIKARRELHYIVLCRVTSSVHIKLTQQQILMNLVKFVNLYKF